MKYKLETWKYCIKKKIIKICFKLQLYKFHMYQVSNLQIYSKNHWKYHTPPPPQISHRLIKSHRDKVNQLSALQKLQLRGILGAISSVYCPLISRVKSDKVKTHVVASQVDLNGIEQNIQYTMTRKMAVILMFYHLTF